MLCSPTPTVLWREWLRSVSNSHVAKDYAHELLILRSPPLRFGVIGMNMVYVGGAETLGKQGLYRPSHVPSPAPALSQHFKRLHRFLLV